MGERKTWTWAGDGWNVRVQENESTLSLEIVLFGLGAPVVATIVVPRHSAAAALSVFANTLYAHSELFCAAVRKHPRRRTSRSAGKQVRPCGPC
jgi:hypothetical protein